MNAAEKGKAMLVDDFAESKVTVKKAALVAAVQANRVKHGDEYAEAHSLYRAALVSALEQLLTKAQTDADCPHTVKLDKPVSHLRDYDRVLAMLEMCVHEEISISETQFTQYVLDEWQWSEQFKHVSHSYRANR